MLSALWFLMQLSLWVVLAVFLARQPGEVNLHWMHYSYSLPTGYFLLAIMLLIVVALVLQRLLDRLARVPRDIKNARERSRERKGRRALLLGLSAVAAGDKKMAAYHAHRAREFLPGDEGLSVFLQAQSHRLLGDEVKARQSFAQLLEHKDTAFLGVRGLLQAALDQGDIRAARDLAARAFELYPDQVWVMRLLYDLDLRLEDWSAALDMLVRLEKKGEKSREAAASDRIAIKMGQVSTLQSEGETKKALSLLKSVCKTQPGFAPAVQALCEYYLVQSPPKLKDAEKLIKKAWKAAPHPEFLELWQQLYASGMAGGKPVRKGASGRLVWYNKLTAMRGDHPLSHVALGRICLEEKLWGEARGHLLKAEGQLEAQGDFDSFDDPAGLYELLAALYSETGEERMAAMYKDKARQAPASKKWVCKESGQIYPQWSAFADGHGGFNTIIWDRPGYGSLPASAIGGADFGARPPIEGPIT